MADHQDTAPVFCKCAVELVFRILIEMIRRLVQEKDVGFPVDQSAETDFSLFSRR